MHSYHGEWVSVAEPQEDAFQTLTAASRPQQNQMHYGLKQTEHASLCCVEMDRVFIQS